MCAGAHVHMVVSARVNLASAELAKHHQQIVAAEG